MCCYVLFAAVAFAGCGADKNTAVSRSNEMTAEKMALKDAQAKNVWNIFRQINRIPRCSKNESQIIEWLRSFAQSHNLACRTDSVGNTVIELPPTKGLENAPAAGGEHCRTVVLQSHVDMVCEKTPDSKHDFAVEMIDVIERDGWVCADGTTLGADNGIGVAMALALIEQKLPHPRLELLFTVDEETGLTGANALQRGFITGKYFINLDGEDDSFIIGCAGGERTEITLPLDLVDPPAGLDCYALKVSGLLGGHSGIDIDKNRANAVALLARALSRLNCKFDLKISSIDAGRTPNAIPRDANAVILLNPSDLVKIRKMTADMESSFKKEFAAAEPNLKVELIKAAEDTEKKIINHKSKIINLLSALPTGVYRMSDEFKGTVETSCNLARVETDLNGKLLRITTSQRSFEPSSMEDITAKITSIANLAGADVNTLGRYPSWRPDPDSSLLKQAKETYKLLHKKEPQVKVVHAGLECAVVGEKFPDIEMLCLGPTIENPHSPRERVNIASVDNAWKFLLALLPSL